MTASPRERRRLTPVPPAPELPPIRPRGRATAIGRVSDHLIKAQALHGQIRELEQQLELHRAWLLAHMEKHHLNALETQGFLASRSVRHNWTYSESTQFEMQRLRNLQEMDKLSGAATDNPTVSLSFRNKP